VSVDFPGLETKTNKKRSKIKKAEDFSSASFRLVPSPRYFAKSRTYWSGVSVPAQVASAAVV
jgi:hypothetical protein